MAKAAKAAKSTKAKSAPKGRTPAKAAKAKAAPAVSTAPAATQRKRSELNVRNPKFMQAKIKVLVEGCNRRPKKPTSKRVAHYKDGMTVAQFIASGGQAGDVRWDAERHNISLSGV